jgi:hypothetical protein
MEYIRFFCSFSDPFSLGQNCPYGTKLRRTHQNFGKKAFRKHVLRRAANRLKIRLGSVRRRFTIFFSLISRRREHSEQQAATLRRTSTRSIDVRYRMHEQSVTCNSKLLPLRSIEVTMNSDDEEAFGTLGDLLTDGIPKMDKSNIDYLSSSHIRGNHMPADIQTSNVEWPESLSLAATKRQNRISLLLTNLQRDGLTQLPYSSENDVQIWVVQALKDALSLMGLSKKLGTKTEYTLFSYSPDIIVVFHHSKGIVLVVEVKKPEKEAKPEVSERMQQKRAAKTSANEANKKIKETEGVFDGEKVAGQMYDYLRGLVNMGNATPFGLLTTMDKACLTWIPSNKSDAMLINELEGLARSTEKVPVTPTKEAEPPATTSSPDPKEKGINLGGSGGEPLPNDPVVEGEVDSADRFVSYSKVYEGVDLVPLFVLAIRCGLKAASGRSERPLPDHAAEVGGDCALVHPDGLEWKRLKKATWNYQGVPQGIIFYLWKALGRGATCQAILACDSKGAACVLKFYLYDDTHLRKLEAHQRAAAEEDMLLAAHALAKLEESRWKEVYPHYSSRVRVVKVNKLWALQMPYFNPVPTLDRLGTLPRIMKVLIAFKDKGYRYKRSDLRWRHVGLDADNNCVLFDLDSLQKGDIDEDDIAGDLAFLEEQV